MKPIFRMSPFLFPIVYFGLVILAGALLLQLSICTVSDDLTFIDALFTATSATCVTGLAVVDTGSYFTMFGQMVILVMIQLGGLGIMSFTGLIFYLWTKRISLVDRIAVGQTLLHDPGFHLGKFLLRIVTWTFFIELVGAFLLFTLDPEGLPPYSAVFHSISAFCNAGFSLYSDSLTTWRNSPWINLVFMVLIILGGIGFSVMAETSALIKHKVLFRRGKVNGKRFLSPHSRVVLETTLFLILAGGTCIYISEFVGFHRDMNLSESLLSSFFQSITCRTAGFNTVDINEMTNISLTVMIILMWIGAGPGSCAGGIKVTTFRVLAAFSISQFSGREQAVVGRFAAGRDTLNKALVLVIFSIIILTIVVFALNITEGGDIPHPQARGLHLDIVFEAVSAFSTVGLSTGLTTGLTFGGKCIITMLMFIGRLGPFLFIETIRSFQEEPRYTYPEESMLIG